MNKKHRTEWI